MYHIKMVEYEHNKLVQYKQVWRTPMMEHNLQYDFMWYFIGISNTMKYDLISYGFNGGWLSSMEGFKDICMKL